MNYQLTAMALLRKHKVFGMVSVGSIDKLTSYLREYNTSGKDLTTKQIKEIIK